MIPQDLLDKLGKSIDELEHAIDVAREVLARGGVDRPDVAVRLDHYSSLTNTQRGLLAVLGTLAWNEDKVSIEQIIRRINAISAMIREDAQDLQSTLHTPQRTTSVDEESWN